MALDKITTNIIADDAVTGAKLENNPTVAGKMTSPSIILAPSGTAPTSPTEGQFYFNSTFDSILIYHNSKWMFADSRHIATGGTVSYYNDGSNDWVIHHFLDTDSKFIFHILKV